MRRDISNLIKQLRRRLVLGACGLLMSVTGVSSVLAGQITVNSFGDGGWYSDDTRSSTGIDLVGINNTHAGKPGSVPSAAHDLQIAQQIQFVDGPAGSTYGGAVFLTGTGSGSGKSNISVISPAGGGFGILDLDFTAKYEMYKANPSSGSTLAFKIGVQSSAWSSSQTGFTAQRSGESVWDLVLVHVPTVTPLTWETVSLDADSGTWFLYDQAGNPFFTPPGGAAGNDKTLQDWLKDTTWGALLNDAKITSIQFGLGSGQGSGLGYVDYLQTNVLNDGDVINFAVVPEPVSLAVWGGLGLLGVVTARRRKRSQK